MLYLTITLCCYAAYSYIVIIMQPGSNTVIPTFPGTRPNTASQDGVEDELLAKQVEDLGNQGRMVEGDA
jgi:hypothetical protein